MVVQWEKDNKTCCKFETIFNRQKYKLIYYFYEVEGLKWS